LGAGWDVIGLVTKVCGPAWTKKRFGKKDNIAKASDNNKDDLDSDPIVLSLVLSYLKRVIFIRKNIEVDDKMMPTGSIYSHENWLDSVKPFGEARFEKGVFNCNKSLVEVLRSYERPFELNNCIFKLFKQSFIKMQTKDKKKQWVEIPEDVSRKLRNISDIFSRNTLKAIVPAYCEYPYAHFVQKRGVSKFVLLQNFPVSTSSTMILLGWIFLRT